MFKVWVVWDLRSKTQREIAARLGISRSYVSRIEKNALGKLRGHNLTQNKGGNAPFYASDLLSRSYFSISAPKIHREFLLRMWCALDGISVFIIDCFHRSCRYFCPSGFMISMVSPTVNLFLWVIYVKPFSSTSSAYPR